jgi:hypothetical protein
MQRKCRVKPRRRFFIFLIQFPALLGNEQSMRQPCHPSGAFNQAHLLSRGTATTMIVMKSLQERWHFADGRPSETVERRKTFMPFDQNVTEQPLSVIHNACGMGQMESGRHSMMAIIIGGIKHV